jgi:hypothetical protein
MEVLKMKREYLDLDDSDETNPEIVPEGGSVRTPLFLVDAVRFDENRQPYFVRASDGADLNLADHQPGYRLATDAARVASSTARQEMIDKATSAFRTRRRRDDEDDEEDEEEDDRYKTEVEGSEGQNRTNPRRIGVSSLTVRSDDSRSLADARARARASYDAMCSRLRSAWRTPARDAGAQPSNSSSPEIMRRYLHGGDEPDSNNAEGLMQRRLRGDVGPDADARERAYAQRKADLENAWRGQTYPRRATAIEQQREKWLGK